MDWKFQALPSNENEKCKMFLKVCSIITALFLAHSSIDAQDTQSLGIYAGIGMMFPSSPNSFSDYWSNGFNVNGGLISPKFLDLMRMKLKFGWATSQFSADMYKPYEISGGEAYIISIGGDLETSVINKFDDRYYLFICLGIDYNISKTNEFELLDNDYENYKADARKQEYFSLNIGAGFDYKLDRTFTLFFLSTYSYGFNGLNEILYLPNEFYRYGYWKGELVKGGVVFHNIDTSTGGNISLFSVLIGVKYKIFF